MSYNKDDERGDIMQTTTTVHWNKGFISQAHNQRDEELCKNESHIDLENKYGDSYHESWYHSDLRDKYLEIFGGAIDDYNAKQKRKDRRIDIDDYMQSVANDTRGKKQTKRVNGKRVVDEDVQRQGKQLSYEITVKVGNTYRKKGDDGRTIYDENNHHVRMEELPRDLQYTILKKYCDTFQNENPNFKVVNIDLHADEGFLNRKGVWEYSEIHPHIEFIPVASGFKQGLSIQNSMNKAMSAMGFNTPDCYDLWAKKEQERLEKITQEEYKKYWFNKNISFYVSHGDLTIYHPVADKTLQGDKSKEQLAQEQELDEARAEIRKDIEKDIIEKEKPTLELRYKKRLKQQIKDEYEEKYKEELKTALKDKYEARIKQLEDELTKARDNYVDRYIELSDDKRNTVEHLKMEDRYCDLYEKSQNVFDLDDEFEL